MHLRRVYQHCSMAELVIPPEYEGGFVEIRGLDEGQAKELVSALNEVRPTRRRVALYSRVASKVGNIERPVLEEIMDTLLSLFGLRDELGTPTPEFVGTIADAMDESGFEGLPFPDRESRDSFETLLTQILEIETFGVAAKAIGLVYEQDHIVHGTPRVLTDIRPIFNSDPKETSVRGAMVTYTLKFEYHEGTETMEMFAALNARQVDQLIAALERAKSKAASLKEWVEGSDDIHYIESQ